MQCGWIEKGYYEIKENQQKEKIAQVKLLLEKLWSENTPAVAACDYEGQLPYGGGIDKFSQTKSKD